MEQNNDCFSNYSRASAISLLMCITHYRIINWLNLGQPQFKMCTSSLLHVIC